MLPICGKHLISQGLGYQSAKLSMTYLVRSRTAFTEMWDHTVARDRGDRGKRVRDGVTEN